MQYVGGRYHGLGNISGLIDVWLPGVGCFHSREDHILMKIMTYHKRLLHLDISFTFIVSSSLESFISVHASVIKWFVAMVLFASYVFLHEIIPGVHLLGLT